MPCCAANCLQDSSWARKNASASGAAVVGAAVVGAAVGGAAVGGGGGAGAGVSVVVHPASATSATPTAHALHRTRPVCHRYSSSRPPRSRQRTAMAIQIACQTMRGINVRRASQ
jgi:hypothetical protein